MRRAFLGESVYDELELWCCCCFLVYIPYALNGWRALGEGGLWVVD